MTILEIKDAKAVVLEENDRLFEKAEAEKRSLTDGETSTITANLQRVKELDLKLESESRKFTDSSKGLKVEAPQEKKASFSLIKAIRDRVEQRELAPEARDIFTVGKMQFREAGITTNGDLTLPSEVRANILAGTATAGQEIVSEEKKAILPPLVDKLILAQAGATILTGLVGNVSIPSYAGTTVAWKGEVVAADDGGGAFTEVEFSPKRITAYVDVSKQFLNQDGVGAERLLLDNIAYAVANKLESTILGLADGSATQPQGMGYLITTGTDTKAVAAVPTFATMVGLETAVDTSNALVGNLSYITNGTGRGILKSIEKATNTGEMLLDGNIMNGYNVYVSNAVATDAGDDTAGELLVFGNWADLCIAQWGGYDITVDPYSKANTGQVRIVINAFFDAKGLRGTSVTDAMAATSVFQYAKSFATLAIKA